MRANINARGVVMLAALLAMLGIGLNAESATPQWRVSSIASIEHTEHDATHRLFVRCSAREFDVYVGFSELLAPGLDSDIPVRYRIDNDEIVSAVWKPVPTWLTWQPPQLGYFAYAPAVPRSVLVSRLLHGNSLWIEATSHDGSTYIARFPLSGSYAAISETLKTCGLTPETL